MADNQLSAALAEIRDRERHATPGPWKAEREHLYDMDDAPFSLPSVTGPDGHEIFSGSVDQPGHDLRFAAHAREDIPRLLAVADTVLALHVRQDRPVISWDRLCLAHRDARGFADRQRGLRDCPDCKFSEIYVCRHCSCPNDFWPCPTYRALLAALTGKEASGG